MNSSVAPIHAAKAGGAGQPRGVAMPVAGILRDLRRVVPGGACRWLFPIVALFVGLGWPVTPLHAEPPPATVYNPKPAAGDLVLPMPEGAEMVFRRARVPGSGFWGDPERVIQLGDASGGIFEGLQRTQISGSFPAADGEGWEIVLAKYELTKGQYLAVMGLDALLETSGDPEDRNLAGLRGRALRDALMQPLTFVSHQDIEVFIRRYNHWLFDPEHPERLESLPTVDGVPGFLRLPTEEEWEFVARGGLPALEAGTFDDRLPFPARELNEHAWHLGNARHQLRPVGLRAANRLGFHDLHGNAQEMTAGLFRPEIWQGKPGGVAVRGGSVSTPAADMRTALRAELDAYAWDPDRQRVQERRSFNTGARLAIGANVVVSSSQRAEIEREYEDYRADIRRTMPVGRTLDNLVAQASVQLGTVEPILARLMDQNADLREPLTAVQEYMDRARERLELAQRESARSLAQDAARNGVNLSVYLSRLERLERTLDSARQLLEISSRYQEQVAAVESSMRDLETAVGEQLQGYRDRVARLGDYEIVYIEQALETLRAAEPPPRERAVLELLGQHLEEYAEQRRAEPERWREAFRERFAGFEG
ncbi:formylglycine-generating enzyme family protein [Thioalkalivibrio paradoxus]|nr:SUMF1/EgtB/PvdO family nonheme iron enzyme [Thioalkalivibrio paradoxus]